MLKLTKPALLLLPFLLIQACATAIATGAATGASVAHDRRTTGTVIDDQGIEFKASHLLHKDKDIHEQSHINVTSYNGIVLVTGETANEKLKAKITDIIRPMEKVKHVYNELAISAPSGLASRSNDVWITSKIKAKMVTDDTTDPLLIKVVTERGIVYLMGVVTPAEAKQAANLAKTTDGVQRVIKIFEYTD